jgi:hypothetical protein
MARALWLPSVLRSAGLTVHEQPDWQSRGSSTFDPLGVIIHATAGRLTIEQDIRVLLTGSTSAPPPIAQLFLARTGEWWVIASGRCNHALTGRAGNLAGLGNTNLLGIEAANDNRGEPWPDVQYRSYVKGVRAICNHMRWGTNRISGHKEHQPPPDKTDPTFDMNAFRAAVANPQGDDVCTAQEWVANEHAWAVSLRVLETVETVRRLEAALAVSAQREQDMLSALGAALQVGTGDLGTAAILSAIDARSADVTGRIAALEAELSAARERIRKAAQAIVNDDDPTNDPAV